MSSRSPAAAPPAPVSPVSGAGAEAAEPGTPPPPPLASAEETRRAMQQLVQQALLQPQPPPEQREHLVLQVQQALGYVRPPDPLRLGVRVLEAAAAELAAAGVAERAAVCADFAGRFRADPLDDAAFLAFQAQCDHWEGIAQDAYFAILADAMRESQLRQAGRARRTGEEPDDVDADADEDDEED